MAYIADGKHGIMPVRDHQNENAVASDHLAGLRLLRDVGAVYASSTRPHGHVLRANAGS